MPGQGWSASLPQNLQQLLLHLESLSKVKPKSEAEAQGLQMAQERILSTMRSKTEYGLREPGDPLTGGEFSGQIGNPPPIRAPYRSENEMPGNFERTQTMGNSLANDAALRNALSHEYTYDPEVGDPVDYYAASQAHVAIDPESAGGKRTAVLEGPLDWRKQLKYRHDPRKWGPTDETVLTEKELGGDAARLYRASRLGKGALKKWMSAMNRMYKMKPHTKKRLMGMIGG